MGGRALPLPVPVVPVARVAPRVSGGSRRPAWLFPFRNVQTLPSRTSDGYTVTPWV